MKSERHTTTPGVETRAAPAATVVVPCLDAEATLGPCLRSLLEQKAEMPFEIIVVDNGSRDRSVSIAREAQRASAGRLRLLHEHGRGAARARNLGMREAAGRFILFVDSDCIAEPGWLCALVAALRDPEVLLAGGEIVGDPEQRAIAARYASSKGLLSQDHTLRHPRAPFFQTANLGVTRRDAMQIGGFDCDLSVAGEDADFCWRLAARHQSRELRLVPQARVRHVHRTTTAGLFRQFRGYGRGDMALACRHGRAIGGETAKLAADLVRIVGLPLFLLAGAVRAVVSGDVLPLAAPWLRVVQTTGRRLGQAEALLRPGRGAGRTGAVAPTDR